jgi:hypothetical protein
MAVMALEWDVRIRIQQKRGDSGAKDSSKKDELRYPQTHTRCASTVSRGKALPRYNELDNLFWNIQAHGRANEGNANVKAIESQWFP